MDRAGDVAAGVAIHQVLAPRVLLAFLSRAKDAPGSQGRRRFCPMLAHFHHDCANQRLYPGCLLLESHR